MAHELDGLRSVYRFNFDGKDKAILELQEHETVDLRSMEANGNLPDGLHVTPRTAFPIKGRAYKHNGETFLTFSHQGGTGTFIGQVVFRDARRVIVAGTLSTADQFDAAPAGEGRQQADGALQQQEQPIIITKP